MKRSRSAGPVANWNLASWRCLVLEEALDLPRFLRVVALFSAIAILVQLGRWFANANDYVGIDPDDTMRLVQVRDFLGGQGWFDLHQYRLGPDGGTLMHWSRLIDWPIAQLIRLYDLFLERSHAEAAGLVTWPLLLILPLLGSTALASYRLGGKGGTLIGLILSLAFLLSATERFRPGAIDHHNVQLVLVTFIAAMLVDPLGRASNFAAAAVAGGAALAIGAETTPLVAVAAVAVSLLWAIKGAPYRRAAIAFGLTFAVGTGALFLATTPLRLWGNVTCDTLSIGYLALAATGGVMLAGGATVLTGRGIAVRLGSLAATGAVVGIIALLVAPQCLRSPLSDLDPLLKTYWISAIREAQSIVSELAVAPQNIGMHYAVGVIAAAVCLMRIARREQVVPHAVLLGLIAISWLVSAMQIRGTLFANYLAFIPLSTFVADLRSLHLARRNDVRAATAFALSALLSVPAVWFVAFNPLNALAKAWPDTNNEQAADLPRVCVTADTIGDFAKMMTGRVLSSFNDGPALLRFTPHSVIAANYHRNQRGMVAAIEIGMAKPDEALARLEAYDIRYILFCHNDPLVTEIAGKYRSGLFAALSGEDIPGYLKELPRTVGGPRIYHIIQH